MTTFSPYCAGSVATRRSIALSPTCVETRPSCGMRRSAMSRSARILMREVTAGTTGRGHDRRLVEHAVDAVADAHLVLVRLEVDVGGAAVDGLGDHALDELDDRRVLAAGAEVDGLRRRGRRAAPAAAAASVSNVSSATARPAPRRRRRPSSGRRCARGRTRCRSARRRPGGPRSRSSPRCRRRRARWPGRPSRRAACGRRRTRPGTAW